MAGPGHVLVIEPQSSGNKLVTAAYELGIEVSVASHNRDDRSLAPELAPFMEGVLQVETNDEQAVLATARSLHAERPLTGVLPGCEYYVQAAAVVADDLGLPGLTPWSAARVRDKALMLDCVEAAGLRVPRHAVVSAEADLERAAEIAGFPCVLKPVDNSGSIHVRRADDLAQLRAAFDRLRQDDRLILGRLWNRQAVVTEYISGPELSVEGYVLDGEVVISAITEKLLGPEPHFNEVGHIMPAQLPDEVKKAVEQYVQGVVGAVGITLGPFHCEVRVSDGGPVLMEIAARLPGDRISDLVGIVTGANLPAITVAAHCGLAPRPEHIDAGAAANYAGIFFFTAPDQRSYDRIHGWDAVSRMPGVVESTIVIGPGQEIPSGEDRRSRIGYILFTADSYEAAKDRCRAAESLVTFT